MFLSDADLDFGAATTTCNTPFRSSRSCASERGSYTWDEGVHFQHSITAEFEGMRGGTSEPSTYLQHASILSRRRRVGVGTPTATGYLPAIARHPHRFLILLPALALPAVRLRRNQPLDPVDQC